MQIFVVCSLAFVVAVLLVLGLVYNGFQDDLQGTILGLPPSPEVVNFDGAGEGICLVWHLTYQEGFSGAEVGELVEHGGIMTECLPENNPCRKAYIDYLGPNVERPSWDPLTLVYAVRNAAAVGCQ